MSKVTPTKGDVVLVMQKAYDRLQALKKAAIAAGIPASEQFGAFNDDALRLGEIFHACSVMVGAELLVSIQVLATIAERSDYEVAEVVKILREELETPIPEIAVEELTRRGVTFSPKD
jgi:hypothetical protein